MTSCTCWKCVDSCHSYPGWMTVEEAKAAIAAGLGPRLMKKALFDGPNTAWKFVGVLCPAIVGHEGKKAPFEARGRCTFLASDRCSIHTSGFKPFVCRKTYACRGVKPRESTWLPSWGTDEGRALVAEWERNHAS